MISKTIEVVSGLESSPAALFVQTASAFNSKISIKQGDRVANAKSIMGMISLGILDGVTVNITAEGDDETDAVNTLTNFLGEKR